MRQRLEACLVPFAGRDLDIDAIVHRGLRDVGTDIEAIHLEALDRPIVLGRKHQQCGHRLRVVHISRRDQNRQHKAQRARQHMALDAAHLLVAVQATRSGLRTRRHALAVQAQTNRLRRDGRHRLRRSALFGAHGPREQGRDISPDVVTSEAIMPSPHGLPENELLRQEASRAAHLFQIQTRVDHLAQVSRQSHIDTRYRLDCLPFRVRQIAGVAPAAIFVSLSHFVNSSHLFANR